MHCHIVIDRSLAPRIELDETSAPSVHFTDDPVATVKQIRKTEKAAELGLIVFVSSRLQRKTIALLASLPAAQVLSRIVVLAAGAAGRAVPAPEAKLAVEYRAGSLIRAEYRFIVRQSAAWFARAFRARREERRLKLTLKDTDRDQEDLINIGRALSTVKNIDTLFRMILGHARKITGADAGTVYLVEQSAAGEKQIRVKYSHTASRAIRFEERVIPCSRDTIAGYVAITGKVLNIPDVSRLTSRGPVSYNASFDREHHYRTKSMLVVPMRDHADEIIGVIQLINSKENHLLAERAGLSPDDIRLTADEDYDRYVVPFAKRYDRLLEAVAGQAAIAIENARMLKRIETMFDEIVKASVFAIESRDQATSGHSLRVARLCDRLAEAINRRMSGPFKDEEFAPLRRTELNYAAILHDFGKVYLDPRLFLKAKKLFPEDLETLMQKIDIAFRQSEIAALAEEVDLLRAGSSPAADETQRALAALAEERAAHRAQLTAARERIRVLNEPSVSREDPALVVNEVAAELAAFACVDFDGRAVELLTDRERASLLVARGSLTEGEKREIESHVEHTYNFVSKIPWPKEWERIPEIARGHHELLDGSGYPRRLRGKDRIPLESRMMCIADIFDALTASDRPYKKAVPVDKALLILRQEAAAGKIDPDLLALFEEERVWENPPVEK